MEIIRDIEQTSPEWFALRCGIPTASSFDKIITSTGKPSTQASGYMNDLLAEWFIGEKKSIYQSAAMTRGIELEPEARALWEFEFDQPVEEVTFCFKDENRLVGCSPDGLAGDFGLLEIKCPNPGTHVGYLKDGGLPLKYKQQVQGQLWVTGKKWCSFMSYCPGMDPFFVTVEPDKEYQKSLDTVINNFIKRMVIDRKHLFKRRKYG